MRLNQYPTSEMCFGIHTTLYAFNVCIHSSYRSLLKLPGQFNQIICRSIELLAIDMYFSEPTRFTATSNQIDTLHVSLSDLMSLPDQYTWINTSNEFIEVVLICECIQKTNIVVKVRHAILFQCQTIEHYNHFKFTHYYLVWVYICQRTQGPNFRIIIILWSWFLLRSRGGIGGMGSLGTSSTVV